MAMNGDREQLNLYVSPTVAERFRGLAVRMGFGRRPSPLLEKLLDTHEWSTQPRAAADARTAYTSALLALPTAAILAEARQFLVDVGDLVNQTGDPEGAVWAAHAILEDYLNHGKTFCPACEHGGVPPGSKHAVTCKFHVAPPPPPMLDDPSFGHGR